MKLLASRMSCERRCNVDETNPSEFFYFFVLVLFRDFDCFFLEIISDALFTFLNIFQLMGKTSHVIKYQTRR